MDYTNYPDFTIPVIVHPAQATPVETPTIDAEGKPTTRTHHKIETFGFQMGWLDAETDQAEVEVTSGAGCGSKWIRMTVKNKETGVTQVLGIDMAKVANDILTHLGYEETS